MAGNVGVVVATYGDQSWEDLAQRACESAHRQTVPVKVAHIHQKGTPALGDVRNAGALSLWGQVDWFVFLDGDDELAPDYVERMLAGTGDIRQPSTLGVRPDGVEDAKPVLLPKRRLIDQNYIVIGALVDAEKFFEVNGFLDYPIYEDWDLWLRMYISGATISAVPEAVYKVHVREDSRNNNVAIQKEYYDRIRSNNLEGFKQRGWK